MGEHTAAPRDGRYGRLVRLGIGAGFVAAAGCAWLLVGAWNGDPAPQGPQSAGCDRLCRDRHGILRYRLTSFQAHPNPIFRPQSQVWFRDRRCVGDGSEAIALANRSQDDLSLHHGKAVANTYARPIRERDVG